MKKHCNVGSGAKKFVAEKSKSKTFQGAMKVKAAAQRRVGRINIPGVR
jgi:hypothetical protein